RCRGPRTTGRGSRARRDPAPRLPRPRGSPSARRTCRSGRSEPAAPSPLARAARHRWRRRHQDVRALPVRPSEMTGRQTWWRALRIQLVDERLGVEGVVAESRRDLLARRARAFEEQGAQELAGLGAAPPVLADLVDEVRAELRRADPRTQVVRRVEP